MMKSPEAAPSRLPYPAGPGPKAAEGARRLLDACLPGQQRDVHGIGQRAPVQFPLLPGVQRGRVKVVRDVEVRRKTQHPLMLFLLDLDLCRRMGREHFDREIRRSMEHDDSGRRSFHREASVPFTVAGARPGAVMTNSSFVGDEGVRVK